MGVPEFVGVKDASIHRVGSIIVGHTKACVPTVFRYEWPDDIKRDVVTPSNREGRITNSDLELAGLLLLWLCMEAVCALSPGCHVGLFSDNQATVSWVRRMASKGSFVAGQILRALALRLKVSGASPLTPLHIPGDKNAMTDIPSRSFGSRPEWHCKTDEELLTLFNRKFPLPDQTSWTVFRPSKGVLTRVTSVLRMKPSTLDKWRRLPGCGRHIDEIGPATSGLWEWTLTFRKPGTNDESGASRGLQQGSGPATTAGAVKSSVELCRRRSRPLARRFPWPSG